MTDRQHWLFHANPARSDVPEQLRAGRPEARRCVTQHAREIAVGDGAVLWLSGRAAGVYAVGEVVEAAADDLERSCLLRWHDLRPDRPISKQQLLAAGGFEGARIIRQPMAGNPLRLTDEEWAVIDRLLET